MRTRRILLFLCVSVALFYSVVFGDHHCKDNNQDHNNDHSQRKGNPHHKHHHHKLQHHHHSNESSEFYKISSTNNEFAFRLFRQVASDQPSKNIIFSPVSISTALAMVSLGARNQTHNQILEGLGFNISEFSEQEIHDGFQHLLHILNDPESELQLNTGNALFINKEWKLLQKFLVDVKNFYDSEAFSTDFQNSEEAKYQINSYVEKKTNGKIVDLLSRVDPATALVLINYIYFRGNWETPFNEEYTKEDDFSVDKNTKVKVPMMHRKGVYNILFENKLGCAVVEMPYKGNASALFILPNHENIKQVEDALQKSTINRWIKMLSKRTMNVFIPKFSISATLDLEAELSKVGITDIFTQQADLSGITEELNLKISKALHKAVLSVDEQGTDAAGATSLHIMPVMFSRSIKFNKPFLIIVYSHLSNSLLFIGKIVNPRT